MTSSAPTAVILPFPALVRVSVALKVSRKLLQIYSRLYILSEF